MGEVPLTLVLGELGLTHMRAPPSRQTPAGWSHDIYSGDELLFTGSAHQVWTWLRESGRYPAPDVS